MKRRKLFNVLWMGRLPGSPLFGLSISPERIRELLSLDRRREPRPHYWIRKTVADFPAPVGSLRFFHATFDDVERVSVEIHAFDRDGELAAVLKSK